MASINLVHVDQTYIKIVCDQATYLEMKDNFSFMVPNYKYHPKFRSGLWDGSICLIDWKTKRILKGLLPDIVEFAEERSIDLEIDPQILQSVAEFEIDEEKSTQFYQKIGAPYQLHDSQMDGFIHCVNNGRSITLAPTANGKSYIIHGLTSFYALQKRRVLVIVDRSQLVEQLRSDMATEYGGSKILNYATVYDKNVDINNTDVYLTTWQSCYNNPDSWFKNFDVLFADEVHKFKAASLKQILDKCGHIKIRHGFTATLDNDSKSDRKLLIGMFGTPHRVATTRELIEAGIIARPTVYAILREYSKKDIASIRREFGHETESGQHVLDFHEEVKFLEENQPRTDFIASLNEKLVGNTLIAFKREVQGNKIFDAVKAVSNASKNVFLINHRVKLQLRIDHAKQIDLMDDATGVVSVGTFGTGISIKNINNIIIACQIKSRITAPQLIGRGLRLSEKKSTLDVYDVGDDLTSNGIPNATLKHFLERLEMYADEGFEIKFKKLMAQP